MHFSPRIYTLSFSSPLSPSSFLSLPLPSTPGMGMGVGRWGEEGGRGGGGGKGRKEEEEELRGGGGNNIYHREECTYISLIIPTHTPGKKGYISPGKKTAHRFP